MSKMYFKGCSGIENPVDFDGREIREGDILTFDYLDPDHTGDMSKFIEKPVFKVSPHRSGKGFFGSGINSELYLHDFRFKFCRVLGVEVKNDD